jgi:hypothetical protein
MRLLKQGRQEEMPEEIRLLFHFETQPMWDFSTG